MCAERKELGGGVEIIKKKIKIKVCPRQNISYIFC